MCVCACDLESLPQGRSLTTTGSTKGTEGSSSTFHRSMAVGDEEGPFVTKWVGFLYSLRAASKVGVRKGSPTRTWAPLSSS